jgi:hypothetical protein
MLQHSFDGKELLSDIDPAVIRAGGITAFANNEPGCYPSL